MFSSIKVVFSAFR